MNTQILLVYLEYFFIDRRKKIAESSIWGVKKKITHNIFVYAKVSATNVSVIDHTMLKHWFSPAHGYEQHQYFDG